ncbi:spermidine synthase [Actinomadura parmotrematis]|uniref:Spermidine synthase n=1 Tax=Actinomadura parmotrematis TaxID=2864039 RepID=A0ABS7FS11_9ACTN|nr:spermidine synthase [Actinomadura parmotrematis]MBW8482760.1 spermidine synthase [Actinomadura parmotrematis]
MDEGTSAGTGGEPVVLERAAGVGGELVLRRAGADYEIISNGVFLMDTRNGESERLLVEAALEGTAGPARVAIGGLGVGFSLARAAADPRVAHVTVVEREPAVVAWHAGPLRPFSAGALEDGRVRVVCADLLDWLQDAVPAGGTQADAGAGARAGAGFDAVCLDIDNGPHWTVTPGNARLYDADGLARLAGLLARGGTLAVWSAGEAPGFAERLAERFADVRARPVPVPRGEPDVVYLARGPR